MYVLVQRTGFCDYFVCSTDPASTIRFNHRLDLAIRFFPAEEARRHKRFGEELRYSKD